MARTDLNISELAEKFVDLRDTIPGDSFNWSWVRPLNQIKYLAIHHSAGSDTQTPNDIANYHINNNGWGGIGYHFLIGKDGTVYYVGDIATARANVANLNEQVIGICLVGNFMAGKMPTNEQIVSTNKLCSYFVKNYPILKILGHKELPGQATACPGDSWPQWKTQISSDLPSAQTDRGAQISEAYRTVLGRDPDMGGLQTYTNSPLTISEIVLAMVNSQEHKVLVERSVNTDSLISQIDNLQTTLASINQQVISLREALAEREQEIRNLKERVAPPPKVDNTVTIVGALMNLYNFVFPPSKVIN